MGATLGMIGICMLSIAPYARAQSSVTLYGIVDGSLLYTSKTIDSTTGGNAGRQLSFSSGGVSSSRFGLKGSEDLGGGLHAIFTLESGINLGTGAIGDSNGNVFGRQAWVGLDGGFGTLKAGLQYSPFFIATYGSDSRGISQFGSGLITYLDSVLVTGLFNPNAVSYTTPDIYGLQGSVMAALGGSAGTYQAGRQYSAAATYHNGPLALDMAYYSGNAGGSAASIPVASTLAFEGRTVGGSYTFGNLTVKASFALYKVAGSFDSRVYSGGVAYTVTPALNLNAGVWVTRDGNNTNNHSILAATGAQYSLSKATMVYAQAGFVNNHGSMDTGLAVNGALYGTQGTTVGVEAGIRHMF
ncbi:porin [Caballeronia sp. SEWSISQ10-4 2]|uniref:porin n=1 Tax=Caballeronia sp. SEWSISQ10-4 2 TaxID=2937438 RepID=UPI00264FDD90|nr:porin [Caballeronia sp. SEWSISQ10-4 2]MDN7179488.1 porin [Caballeronia sp. SEWSISQ10-4 2]